MPEGDQCRGLAVVVAGIVEAAGTAQIAGGVWCCVGLAVLAAQTLRAARA